MRPLAIPTAGGFVSALLLFAVLAPGLTTRGATPGNDVPTVLYTEASVRSFIPLGFHNENITIEVTIDGDGRVIDYSLPNGPSKDPALHRSIENYLLVHPVHSRTKLRSAREGEGADLVPKQPHRSKGLARLEWPDAASVSISLSNRTILRTNRLRRLPLSGSDRHRNRARQGSSH